MTREDINKIMLDHMNGKLTLAEALWKAYAIGHSEGSGVHS